MSRILIASISILWGILVFLPGSVLLMPALRRATFATLPLVIAAFLAADEERQWRRYLRRLYAVMLALFGLVILGGLGSIPYLIAAILLMRPEIRKVFPRRKLGAPLTSGGLVLGLLGSFIWWQWFHNPLPGDKQLIDHFNAHRAEFEQLAQGYRNHRDGKKSYDSTAEALVLMGRAGVNHVIGASGGFGDWFPEPYSEHTLQVIKALEVRPVEKLATKEEIIETYRCEFPELFEKFPPVQYLHQVERIVYPIKFYLGPDPTVLSFGRTTLRYFGSFLNKGFCYYPQPPRVENGHIINASYSLRDNAYTRPGLRVFDSLDNYPPKWKRGECVEKRIDDHWFICMCRNTP